MDTVVANQPWSSSKLQHFILRLISFPLVYMLSFLSRILLTFQSSISHFAGFPVVAQIGHQNWSSKSILLKASFSFLVFMYVKIAVNFNNLTKERISIFMQSIIQNNFFFWFKSILLKELVMRLREKTQLAIPLELWQWVSAAKPRFTGHTGHHPSPLFLSPRATTLCHFPTCVITVLIAQ